MASNDRFDKEAAEWDNNPFTVKSSQFALSALLENVPQLQAASGEAGEKSEYRPFLLGGLLLEACSCCLKLMQPGYGLALFLVVEAVYMSAFRDCRSA
jgi:hypothetical protein